MVITRERGMGIEGADDIFILADTTHELVIQVVITPVTMGRLGTGLMISR